MYDYIYENLEELIEEPRNIDFECSDEENKRRRRTRCKMSTKNRIIHFLHTMAAAPNVFDEAAMNAWNISSVSKDFRWVSLQFVKRFEMNG